MWQGRAACPLVSAVLARGLRAEIPQFFYAAEIAAAKMLLFFRKSTAMDILTRRVDKEVRYGSGQGYEEGFHGHLRHCAF